jgi:nucleoside 2-deoxyribosyltransferase
MTSDVFPDQTGRAFGSDVFRVYLAGPMVFDPDPIAIFDRMKALCLVHGVIGVAPLDNQIGLEGIAPGRDLLERIVRADIALMDELEAAVFCLDGFRRGPEMDAGTAFEVGYMKALGKPIAGWTRDIRLYPERVGEFFKQRLMPDTRHDDLSGRRTIPTRAGITRTEAGSVGGTSGLLRDPDGVLVHSEGCVQNAMVHVGIELAGGIVAVDADWERAFSLAVASVAAQLRARLVAAAVSPP